jgi:hypothetical protein
MRFKGELTPETLLDEYNRWWIDHGNVRDPHDQRFGQYIWNKYARRDVQTGFP